MPDIIRPRHAPALATRHGSNEAHSAADVPTITPVSACDPGLTVPDVAIKSLLGRAITGAATDHIAATPAFATVVTLDPTAL